jgi:hypothetical protein
LDIEQVREKLREHQGLLTAVLGVVIFAAVGFFLMQIYYMLNPPPPPEDIVMGYFYDQNTKELYALPASTAAPMERPSGPFEGEPAGVKAHVFACGQCDDEAKRFIGYLEKPLPPEDRPPPDDPRSEVFLMKRPDDKKWVESDSRQAAQLVEEVFNRCASGERTNFCRPEAAAAD